MQPDDDLVTEEDRLELLAYLEYDDPAAALDALMATEHGSFVDDEVRKWRAKGVLRRAGRERHT